MTQYNNLPLTHLPNSQLTKLKSGKENTTELILNLSSDMIVDSNDKTNFPQKLLLTDRQDSKLCKALANNSSANMKLPKTEICKIVQSGEFLGRRPEPLLKIGLT